MSGGGWEYNRFDLFEKALLDEHCDCPPKCKCEKCTNKDGTKKAKKSSGAKPDYLDVDKDGDKEEDMKDALASDGGAVSEGMLPLPTEKIERQANKAYAKEVVAAKSGDEKETNKQMQRRIAMKDPSSRKAQLKKEDYGYSDVYENRMAAYTAGESEKGGDNSAAKVTGGKTVDIKDLPKLKEPSAEEKAKARKALGLTKESVELFSVEELDAISNILGEGLSVADQMKASNEYFKKRNARSDEEKAADEARDAKSRAERSAMHKKPDPYKARGGESD